MDLYSVALCSVVFYRVEIERIELRLQRLRVFTWFRGFEMFLFIVHIIAWTLLVLKFIGSINVLLCSVARGTTFIECSLGRWRV